MIVAAGRNGVIGRDNDLPWRLPDDLAHFKRLTLGKPIVMGRKTWESLGRPLPGRHNIVVSRNPAFSAVGASVVGSLDAALMLARDAGEVMLIGGAELFALGLPHAQRLYLTEVDAAPAGDVYFPPLDKTQWRETHREHHPADARHAAAFDFVTLERLPRAA